MNTKKWLWWTLTILLTLVVLTGIGFAGFRIGMTQAANLPNGMPFMYGHAHGFDGNWMHNGFGEMGFHHGRRGGFSFFSPLFGLIQLAFWGGLIWLGYTFAKRSGWRIVKTTPVVEEKKDEA